MPAEPSDYSHRFHVGNHGDVWKHVALCAVLHHLGGRVRYVLDTHAGEGAYRLGPTGEWTAGVGRLWSAPTDDPAVRRWLTAVGSPAARAYPGSPKLVLDALGPGGRLTACEIQPEAAGALARNLPDPRLDLRVEDGLSVNVPADLVLIDPPYVRREEWQEAAAGALSARRRPARPVVMLWYPIKSFNRPNALLAALRGASEAWTALELIVTPVELRRPQLAGSGLVLFGAPSEAVAELLAAAGTLGPRLATHDGRWQLRVFAEGEPDQRTSTR